MRKSPKTITIGIPAYNEEQNIAKLLKQILGQKITSGAVINIIVASDGSTDKTVELVESLKNKKIILIDGKKNQGKAYRQNQIIERANSDILVLFDADISIEDNLFIEKLIKPIFRKQADFTSSALIELPARGFFEKVLAVSMQLKRILFSKLKNGNNIYNCHGPARAFSRQAYKLLSFIESDGEDMYSYLACVKKGLKFQSIDKAVVYYRLPSNLSDHAKQSIRFVASESMYEKYFNSGFGEREFEIPMAVYLQAFWKALPIILKNIIYVCVYLGVYFYTKIFSPKVNYQDTWHLASTKSI